MASPLVGGNVVVIGKEIVDAKLLAAAPRILAQNRAMVGQMLDFVKIETVPQIPIGPGHFGYHARDTFTTAVRSEGVMTNGVLKAAVQAYWREKGTRRGERARMTAHHALAGIKKFIRFYYGSAQWWRL